MSPSGRETGESLLKEIIATAKESPLQNSGASQTPSPNGGGGSGSSSPNLQPQPPKKTKLTTAQIFRIFSALTGAALIFLGSFLAYVVLNPTQAQFFISIGINPSDIATLLKKLVFFVFGGITFALSIVFFYFLFRFFYTKKELKRTKVIYSFLSATTFLLLFFTVGFWIFLFQQIGASDFINPNGGVIIYDNDQLLSEPLSDGAQIRNYSNLIGPLTLRFDLSSDARYVSKFMEIQSFEIDYNGDGAKDVEGNDPQRNESLIYTYSNKGKILPLGRYIGIDRATRKQIVRQIQLPTLNIAGVLKISEDTLQAKKIMVIDASDLISFGKISWYTFDDPSTLKSQDAIFSITRQEKENIVCLSLQVRKTSDASCAKYIRIPETSRGKIQAKIQSLQNSESPFEYTFSLTDLVLNGGEILSYSWSVNGSVLSKEPQFIYNFGGYGKYQISVNLVDTSGNKEIITDSIFLSKPLALVRSGTSPSRLQIRENPSGKEIQEGKYDVGVQAYIIDSIPVGTKLLFDASDITVRDYGYSYISSSWKVIGGPEKDGKTFQYEFLQPGRTELIIRHQFSPKSSTSSDVAYATERVILLIEDLELVPRIDVTQETDYAPSRVRFDGSASTVKNGSITKFIYNFGEGKGDVEGDAIQTYQYNFAGEYEVSLTVVKNDGTRAVQKTKIIIKEPPKIVAIQSSISDPLVGNPIDFSPQGTIGQVSSVLWDFGDGNTSSEMNPTHIFSSAKNFTVKLTVTFSDGTLLMNEKVVVVRSE